MRRNNRNRREKTSQTASKKVSFRKCDWLRLSVNFVVTYLAASGGYERALRPQGFLLEKPEPLPPDAMHEANCLGWWKVLGLRHYYINLFKNPDGYLTASVIYWWKL